MTNEEIANEIRAFENELVELRKVVPASLEEFSSLRLRYDVAMAKLQGYQMQLQARGMVASLEAPAEIAPEATA